MSTLILLSENGVLRRFEAGDGATCLEIRRIFMCGRADEQFESRIKGTVSDRQLTIQPEEQLDALLVDFCLGEELIADTQFKCLNPLGKGIWELKTPDVRMFGWFHEKDCFICSAIDAAWHVKQFGLYAAYIEEAVRLREELFGANLSHVEGTEPGDVISNWC